MPDDLTLVKRCQAGDQEAYRVLVERYQKKAFALACGMVKDRDEAMDIAQEAFVKVFRNIESFKGDSAFYTWLYRIVSNLAVDHLRKGSVALKDKAEFDENLAEDDTATAGILSTRLGQDPHKEAVRGELAKKINEALAQVPEKHREILLMRELDGMSYEDLSKTLGIPKGTVMSRLFHARAKVQKLLAEYVGEGGKKAENEA